jgi:hypothetical protein
LRCWSAKVIAAPVRPLLVAFSTAPSILGKAAIEIRYHTRLHLKPRLDIGGPFGLIHLAGNGVLDMRLGQEAVGADGVERHQDNHQGRPVLNKQIATGHARCVIETALTRSKGGLR